MGGLRRVGAVGGEGCPDVLWQDDDRTFCRARRTDASGSLQTCTVIQLDADQPSPASVARLAHEFALRDSLDGAWALRPLELVRRQGRTMLVLDAFEGRPLHRAGSVPMDLEPFLRLGIALLGAIARMHEQGLIHKDIKPANVLVSTSGDVRLTGFGIASRLPRERQAMQAENIIVGTLPYMAPEQTGRMNRSIDSRSDLYSTGVVLYELITGSLPFQATDPVGWIHCHVARNPAPPHDRSPSIPVAVSAIVMRLLAKAPEDRYYTAAGVEHDLRRCLADLAATGTPGVFALGERDHPDRLLIAEKLYGREREVQALLSVRTGVAETGRSALVLIAGYSGVGKSSVVNELHRAVVSNGGLFASSKLDQDQAVRPYAAFARAFQELIRMLLGKPEAELAPWRAALQEALGMNGALMLELVPELRHIVGEQPPLVDVSAQNAHRRLELVVRRFIGVFARPGRPLTLVLDDLQWLDPATLDLLGHLLMATDVPHLLVVGAYRDNEVGTKHPLARLCEELRQGGSAVHTVKLSPLGVRDLERLIAESLHATNDFIGPLARLVRRKTGGNPFFAIQFLGELADQGFLTFDRAMGSWSWDQGGALAKKYSTNVADLLVRRLGRLPAATRHLLQQLACIGHACELSTLERVCGVQRDGLERALLPALRQGLVVLSGDDCSFVHDRVQEAAYALIPQDARARRHLDIGRRLRASTAEDRRKEVVFEIVHHLNKGDSLITDPRECEDLARLNLMAGRCAKSSTAYASALGYFSIGAALWARAGATSLDDLSFSLALEQSECEFLTGDMEGAQARLARLSPRAASRAQSAAVASIQIDVYIALDKADRAIDVCLGYLGKTGAEWHPRPTDEEVRRAYERVRALIGEREIEDLIDLPLMTAPEPVAMMDVMIKALVPASFMDVNLFSLLLWRMLALSLEYGNTDASCQAYVHIGRIAGPGLGDPALGFRFARLGYELVEQRGLKRFQARTYLGYAVLSVTWLPMRTARDLIRRAFVVANETGDLTYAAFSCHHLISNLIAAGDPLAEVQREAERCLAFARGARFNLETDVVATQLALVRMLRGEATTFGRLDGPQFDERQFEQHLRDDPRLAFAASWYWIRKLQARFIAGDHADAVAVATKAEPLMRIAPSHFRTAEYRFYEALSRAAAHDNSNPARAEQAPAAVISHHGELLEWAGSCPENFASRAALLGAEIARIERRDLDAQRLYEAAVRTARENGLVHHRAIAAERAARFHAARELDTIARAYLGEARQAYLEWGAIGKVRQLDATHPPMRNAQSPSSLSTIAAPLDELDLATLIRVSQRVSSEIVLEDLIDTTMRAAIEQAGAERGLLILSRGDTYRVEAEAKISGESVVVSLEQADVDEAVLPRSVFLYVTRTREHVLLNDASADNPFVADEYLRANSSRSVLCLPLINKARLLGVLYLENRLSTRIFSPARISMLRLIASAAAVSLENAQLYRELTERDAKVRRLFSANIIGIFTWHLDGRVLDANDAFLRMVGFDAADIESGRLRWKDFMPSQWDPANDAVMDVLLAQGAVSPFEGEYVRKDGSRVPVLIGAALFDATPTEGVAFVLDLTDRKHAEEMARESLRRYHEVEMRLSDANRVASIGQLSASIAHEVNQPLAGILTNAGVCLRLLAARPPDVEGALDTARRTIRDVNRASEVVKRLRGLFGRNLADPVPVDLNEAVREVIDMASANLRMSGIDVTTRLAAALPLVMADRVQLQQVIMNLLRNALEALQPVQGRPRKILVATGRVEPEEVQLAVTDNGEGLDPGGMDKLFEPFYTTKRDGMGIGLSLSRSIIERHRGRLWAVRNEGPGATFLFTLPVNEEVAETPSVVGDVSQADGTTRPDDLPEERRGCA